MPQGGKARRSKDPCGVCRSPTFEIWHSDGHGMEELLEIHCNQCGAAWDGEGKPRSQPRNVALLNNLHKEGVRIAPISVPLRMRR